MDMQKKKITMDTAERIRQLRRGQSLSQEALALRANLNPAYFGQIERGLKCPTIDTLYKIATALGVPPAELLSQQPPPANSSSYQDRLEKLLTQIPENKQEQFLRLLEDMIAILR